MELGDDFRKHFHQRDGYCFPDWEAICRLTDAGVPETELAEHWIALGRQFRKHEAHWDEATIQQFWSGEAWAIPGESFALAYDLAHILLRKIESDLGASRPMLLSFVGSADFQDAGEESFRRVFGAELGDLAGDFLGDGPWSPRPDTWPSANLPA